MNTCICTCATWICVTCVFIEYVHVAYLYIHIGDHSPQDVAVDPGNHLGETQPQHFTDLGHGFPPGQLSLATTLSCRLNCVNKRVTSSFFFFNETLHQSSALSVAQHCVKIGGDYNLQQPHNLYKSGLTLRWTRMDRSHSCSKMWNK